VSTAFLDLTERAPRALALDLERPAWGAGDVALTLNRSPIGRLVLRSGRESYPVLLPVEAQRPGLNRLRLSFESGGATEPPPPPGPPVRLHGLSVGRPDGPAAVRSLEVRRTRGDTPVSLAQAVGTSLEYGIRLPEAAELRFTPRLAASVEGWMSFGVEVTPEGDSARILARVEMRGGQASREVRVPFPDKPGSPVLLSLTAEAGPATSGKVLGEWLAPRVLGVRKRGPEAGTSAPGAALRGLRRRLESVGVLLIVLDAAAAGHFGCYGYERGTTPAIDRLASESAVFDRAYAPASYTRAAMASLWTSQHPDQHHHGVRSDSPLPESRVVLPELLRDRGVPSAAFIANPNAGEPAGLTRGFTNVRHLYLDEGGAKASAFLEPLEAALSAGGEGPFLVYAHYVEPHFPYDPPPPFDTLFGPDAPLPPSVRRNHGWILSVNKHEVRPTAGERAHLVRMYDGNLAFADREVGRLRESLEKRSLWDELLVIVTADHGEELLEHGLVGHAAQVYEESVRIPLIVRLPGESRSRRFDEPVDLIDLGATLADVFGVASEAAGHFRGRSLLPLLAGGALPPRNIVSQTRSDRPTYSRFDGQLKLIHDPRWGATELYDIREDPGERRNLAGLRPVETELRRQSLYRWLRDLDRGEPATGAGVPVSPEAEEALRALGYLN
jgi:arylsulfatase A-like enzyme